MRNKRFIYLLGAVLLAGLLMVVFLNYSPKKKVNKPVSKIQYKSSNWIDAYSLDGINPFDLFLYRELVIASDDITEFNAYTNYLLLDSITKLDSSLLMYVGNNFTFTQTEVNQLLTSVELGNDFFLSVEKTPDYLFSKLLNKQELRFIQHKKTPHLIGNHTYDMYNVYEGDTVMGFWDLFYSPSLTPQTEIITTINGEASYVKIPYGLGNVFLHLNPRVFTNNNILRPEGKSYLKEVIATWNKPHIQWLTFAKYEPVPYEWDGEEYPEDPSLLTELFKHPAFRWGFIFSLLGLFLYFIFRSKRRRPIIPAREDTQNTGFSYVDTLSGIYFNNNRPEKVLKIMFQNFKTAVYSHFYIDLSKENPEKAILSLSQKSNIPTPEIQEILDRFNIGTSVDNDFLVKTYRLQRIFYLKSGIWDENIEHSSLSNTVSIYRKRNQYLGVLALGIILIIFGFYLLTKSVGVGVLFWPVGMLGIVIGIHALSAPLFKLTSHTIEIIPILGFKRTILLENIKFIEERNQYLVFKLKNNKEHKVQLSQIEEKDIKTIDGFIKRIKNE